MSSTCVDAEWLAKHPQFLRGPHKKPKGYAAAPGTGPKGETCRSCAHMVRKVMANTYLKCALMQMVWTGGPGTDIKARSPACHFWKTKGYE